MKIERIQISDIPPFKRIDLSLPDGLCVIVDKNETGKSTLAMAILESFYDLKKRKKGLSQRGGGAIILELSLNGEHYRIESKMISGKLSKSVKKNGRDIYFKNEDIGKRLFNLDLDDFTKTAYVGQHELIELKGTESLVKHLERIVDSSSDTTAKEALERLERGLNEYSLQSVLGKGKVDSALDRLDKEITTMESRAKTLKESIEKEIDVLRKYEEFKKKRDGMEQRDLILKHQKRLHDLKRQEMIIQNLIEIEREIQTLMFYRDFPVDKFEVIKRVSAVLEEKKKELSRISGEYSKCTEELKRLIMVEIEKFPELKSLEPEGIRDLINELKILKELYEDLSHIDKELRRKKENYRWNLQRHMEIHRIWENIAPVERRMIAEFREKNERINRKITELTSELEKSISKIKMVRIYFAIFFILAGIFLYVLRDVIGFIPSLSIFIISGIVLYGIYRSKTEGPYLTCREKKENINKLNLELRSLEHNYESFRDTYQLSYEEYMEYMSAISDIGEIIHLEKKIDEVNNEISQIRERISSILKKDIDYSFIEETTRNCEMVRALKVDIIRYKKKIDGFKEEIERLDREIKEGIQTLKSFSEEAGISFNEEDINGFIEMCSTAKKGRERLEKLLHEKENLKKEKYDDDYISRLREEVERYNGTISVAEEVLPQKIEEIEDEINRVSQKMKDLDKSVEDIKMRYLEIIQHKDELERLGEELHAKKVFRERLDRYKRSLETAIEAIKTISKEHHMVWSDILNNRVTDILRMITSKDYSIRFKPDLSFKVMLDDMTVLDNKKDIENILSGGLIEQIYLSIRMAICDYLSKDVKLPLILDEPFAHADDERFMNGMGFLINEFSKTRQIIVLSCHEHRHRLFQDRFPEVTIKNITYH